MSETVIVKGEGITLDLLLWRRHGVRGQGLIEDALAMNRGIAALGPFLPPGTAVTLPELLPAQPFTERPIVTLFGSIRPH